MLLKFRLSQINRFIACTVFNCSLISPTKTLHANPLKPRLKVPILFVSGWGAEFGSEFSWSLGMLQQLKVPGVSIYLANLKPFAGVDIRGPMLIEEIGRVLNLSGRKKLHIVAHSMGGIDARFATSKLGFHDKIASIVTVSTPHRGTDVVKLPAKLFRLVGPGKIADFGAWLGKQSLKIRSTVDAKEYSRGIQQLTPEHMREFNRMIPDKPNIFYQSWAAVSGWRLSDERVKNACQNKFFTHQKMSSHLRPKLHISASMLSQRPNDGLVTVASAKWRGFRGCVVADHIDLVGKGRNDLQRRYILSFYRSMISELKNQLSQSENRTRSKP